MRLAPIVGLLLMASCHDPEQNYPDTDVAQMPDGAPFKYRGLILRFPEGSVEGRIEEGDGLGPWARLVPDARVSGDAVGAHYYVDLGRSSTGEEGPIGYGLGYGFYPSDALRTNLGDRYVMYCQPPKRKMPAFNCAALLRTLPFAAIQFQDRPASVSEARALVENAETFLAKAKVSG